MKSISRVILSAILLVLTGLLVAAAHFATDWFFSFYPAFSRRAVGVLAAITAPLPFALWEVLVLLLALWAVYTLARCFSRHRGFLTWLSGVLLGVSAAVFLFVGLWGLGHFGPKAGEQLGLETRPYTADELYAAAAHYADQASAYALLVERNAEGVVQFSPFKTLAAQAGEGYEKLAELYDCFGGSTVRPKRLTAWKLYSSFGVTGVFLAFTGESSVNPDTFEASIPFTMCHEIGHRMAFPAENDANFCAYLACMANESVEFRYSGAYSAFIYCYNALHAENPDRAAEIWNRVAEPVRADARAATAHYRQYEGKIQDAAQKVNDAYLKTFQEEDGVKSYGAVADYLIALYLTGEI